jgi:biopolymer transport protein ExbB/TolQ
MLKIGALIQEGNPFIMLACVALLSVVVITIERFYTLYFRYRLKVPPFRKALEQALQEMDLNKALRIASINQNHPVCKVARAGLLRANGGDRELVRAMETAQLECTPRIVGLTPFLAMLGNLGTLLGLIGTVFGMIAAFEGLGVSDSGAKQEILARGIALAMNSTGLGLIVAIPGTFFATLFGFRQEKLVDQMEETTLTVAGAIGAAAREAKLRAQQGQR